MEQLIFNKYQSSLEELKIDSYPQEVQNEFFEAINGIPFVKNLISPTRLYCKDLPRDTKGRAIIDITNPPIIEDTDYFRPTALHFKKYGCLTRLRPNLNPNSEFGKWLREEIKRIWEGYTRESDGAWVTGDMYWYLNYCPIVQSKIRKGTKIADRIVDLPEFWEGIAFRSYYIEEARLAAEHCAEIAKRGASKSYFVASILSKLFVVGDNVKTKENVRAMVTAYQKEYLTKDGTLNKFVEMVDFQAQHTQFPSKRLRSSLQDMQWKMGYVDLDSGAQRGTLNEVIGVSSKDDPDKLRGKRPHPLHCNVLTTDGIKKWGDLVVGDYVYSQNGNPVKVVDVIDYDNDDIYKITLKDGRVTYAQGDHLFPVYYRTAGKIKCRNEKVKNLLTTKWYNKKGIATYKWAIPKNDCVQFKEQIVPIDPYVLGLYLGDGDYAHSWNNHLNLTMSPDDFNSIIRYIPYDVKISMYRDITHHIMIDKAKDILKSLGLKNKKSDDKFIPDCYLFNSEENRIKLLNGLLDTDGSCTKDYGVIEYSTKSERLKENFLFLCRSLGFNCTSKNKIIKGKTYYRCYVYTSDDRLFNLERKRANLKSKCSAYSDRCPIDTIELYSNEKCRCITVDNPDGLYLIDDFIVTHNSTKIIIEEFGNFPKVVDTYRVILPSVQEGDIVFGQMILIGTGGSEGADFAGAQEIIYNPKGYNIHALPNVYDKSSQGKSECIFFFGAYLNRKGCYNEDGISDVTKAILEICYNRFIVKYNTTDPMALTRTKAENPLTLQEAIMRRDGSIFPVASLLDRLGEIDSNPSEYNDVYVGDLKLNTDGNVDFIPSSKLPIREFPHKDNKQEGCIEIFKMPEKDSSGKVFSGRYIAGCDPYDDDSADTMSLGSIHILDLWTDKLVAEYTGRPMYADDFYEKCRLLCLFFNARLNYESNKKGLFSYFSKMNCLYLLTDVLEYLKDKDMIKGNLIGNKSKGTNATQPINNYARSLIRNWLILPVSVIQTVDGIEQEVTVYNLNFIRNRALIQELSQWNIDGNFDRVSALGMLMLLREDRMITFGGNPQKQKEVPSTYLGNDDFFKNNYDNRMNFK